MLLQRLSAPLRMGILVSCGRKEGEIVHMEIIVLCKAPLSALEFCRNGGNLAQIGLLSG